MGDVWAFFFVQKLQLKIIEKIVGRECNGIALATEIKLKRIYCKGNFN